MKRWIVVLLALSLVVGAMATPASAGKKKKKKPKKIERVVEFEYACPCAGLFQLGGLTGGDPNLGGGVFAVGGEESYLTAEAVDLSGQAVEVSIQQDTDGDGFNNAVGEFCGATEEPMPINPGLEIRVFVNGVGACGTTPLLGLGGTITFTLSNLP